MKIDTITTEIKTMIESKKFKHVIFILAGIFAVLFIFQFGAAFGYRRAAFSYHMGDNYYRAFGPQPPAPGERYFLSDISGAHGVSGKIIGLSIPTFIVSENNGTEKIVRIGDDTLLRKFRSAIAAEDLRTGDLVIVVGEPNDDAEIEASLIRVLPPLPATTTVPPSSGAQYFEQSIN